MGEKCSKRILTCLRGTKYDEINISHSDIQKNIASVLLIISIFHVQDLTKVMHTLCALSINSWKNILY